MSTGEKILVVGLIVFIILVITGVVIWLVLRKKTPEETQCQSSADCSSGQICSNGVCQSQTGCQISGCTGGLICGPSGTCIIPSDVCSPTCGYGYICQNNSCVTGCVLNSDCTGGQVCGGSGICIFSCTGDNDCTGGFCIAGACSAIGQSYQNFNLKTDNGYYLGTIAGAMDLFTCQSQGLTDIGIYNYNASDGTIRPINDFSQCLYYDNSGMISKTLCSETGYTQQTQFKFDNQKNLLTNGDNTPQCIQVTNTQFVDGSPCYLSTLGNCSGNNILRLFQK